MKLSIVNKDSPQSFEVATMSLVEACCSRNSMSTLLEDLIHAAHTRRHRSHIERLLYDDVDTKQPG